MILARILILAAFCAVCSNLRAAEIQWHTSLRQAQQQDASFHRPLLVYFESSNCVFCRKLEHTTWSDARVAARVAAGFVPLRINSRRSAELVRQLGVKVFPTTLVVSPEGLVLGRQSGYLDATAMLNYLQPKPTVWIPQTAVR